jgi:TPR repeat protein
MMFSPCRILAVVMIAMPMVAGLPALAAAAEDDGASAKWYRLATEQGHGEAQYNLGLMYFLGRGVAVDYVRARMWIDLAAEHGDGKAPGGRKELGKYISPGQIAEARKLVREWLARHGK